MLQVYIALIWAISGVAVLSLMYQLMPPRGLRQLKPRFALLPKYVFEIADIEAFERSMVAEGFAKTRLGHYSRGSVFGDFVASWVKLRVKIDYENARAELGSPLFAIAFDTGDFWELAGKLKGV